MKRGTNTFLGKLIMKGLYWKFNIFKLDVRYDMRYMRYDILMRYGSNSF